MEHLTYWLALKAVRGVGNRLFLQLLKRFGKPENVFKASREALLGVDGINDRLVSSIRGQEIEGHVERDLELVRKNGCRMVTFLDAEYPALLRQIHDPPPLLYVYGNLGNDSFKVAIVGSRNATTYGRTVTTRLSADLATHGFWVVSGMARGIDSAAHRGALSAGGKTIAVLGCGLGTVYPAENKKLFHRISENGAVISEFPFLTPPDAHRFPMRNRIISGLSLGTVIAEATHKSGSLITARLAAEQGREVFAVPGSVTSFKSMGTHGLIKDGAKLVEHINDIIEELNVLPRLPPVTRPNASAAEVTPGEREILSELTPYPTHIDCLVRQLSLPAGEVSSLLLHLELKGLVTQSPGKLFSISESV